MISTWKDATLCAVSAFLGMAILTPNMFYWVVFCLLLLCPWKKVGAYVDQATDSYIQYRVSQQSGVWILPRSETRLPLREN